MHDLFGSPDKPATPAPPEGYDIATITAFIASVRWQFARSMPQSPHEYCMRKWVVEAGRDDEFLAAVHFIWTNGVQRGWPYGSRKPSHEHTYLAVGPWEYWAMGDPGCRGCKGGELGIINRARINPPQQSTLI